MAGTLQQAEATLARMDSAVAEVGLVGLLLGALLSVGCFGVDGATGARSSSCLLNSGSGLGSSPGLPATGQAGDRFARDACYLAKRPEKPDSHREAVAGVLSVMPSPDVVWIDLEKLNLEKGARVQGFDMASDLQASGEVASQSRKVKPFGFSAETRWPAPPHPPVQAWGYSRSSLAPL